MHGNQKLTKEQVATMRSEYLKGARQVELAKTYGVSQPHVHAIIKGKVHTDILTHCIDCGVQTSPGTGSKRCPACWESRCGQN